MKRSAQKPTLSDILKNDTRPRSRKNERDASDELAKMFDDGTALPSAKPAPATQGTQGTLPTQGSQPIAPARDFHKVANSIAREAVPAGLFKGKSKQIYDYLYLRTRGAIVPARVVQVTRREIMAGAHIGSDKTLRENLTHLRRVGLISWGGETGAQDGNLYTVYLPEEATTPATQGTQGTVGTPGQNLPDVPAVENTQGTQGLTPNYQRTSDEPQTSFKTTEQNTDDEASRQLLAPFEQLIRQLFEASREVTGRETSKADASKWGELAELLTTELKIAAARTDTISSVPAFLAEHLRRRLFKKDKAQLESEEKAAQAPDSRKIDASQCPSCHGVGMWYPEGFDKGVAKCDHAAMRAPLSPTESES